MKIRKSGGIPSPTRSRAPVGIAGSLPTFFPLRRPPARGA
nr:MAG TPA: hypothetical protein [Caudoviricetes sp.]